MAYKDIAPLSNQVTILAGLCVVGAMAFGLALSYYKNVLFDQRLDVMKGQNDDLRAEITDGYKNLEYLQSLQYKDKYAKQNLNKINPGEKVLIFTDVVSTPATELADPVAHDVQKNAQYEELLRNMPVFEHWKLFLFRRNELENLRTQL